MANEATLDWKFGTVTVELVLFSEPFIASFLLCNDNPRYSLAEILCFIGIGVYCSLVLHSI